MSLNKPGADGNKPGAEIKETMLAKKRQNIRRRKWAVRMDEEVEASLQEGQG